MFTWKCNYSPDAILALVRENDDLFLWNKEQEEKLKTYSPDVLTVWKVDGDRRFAYEFHLHGEVYCLMGVRNQHIGVRP